MNSCTVQDVNQSSLGDGAFDQWLALEMVHTTSMNTANGPGMEFRITGPGISRTITLDSYRWPGLGCPGAVTLA